MRKILAIAYKDIRLRFSSPSEWLFFIILPIIFTVLLAGGTGGANVDNRIRLAVVDTAQTTLSAELLAALESSEAVRPDLMTLEKAEDQFEARRVSALLIIPPGFDQAGLEKGSLTLELRQQASSLNALVAERAVRAVMGRVGQAADIARSSLAEAERIRSFALQAERQSFFQAAFAQARALLANAPTRIKVSQGSTPDSVEYDPRANSSAGQLITWVFVPLIGLSGIFAFERQKGTLRRLLTTPTSKATYILGAIFGMLVTALFQITLLVSFGILVMKLNWAHDLGALAVIMIASVLAAAALGTMLGTLVKTESQASGLSIMLGMVMALLGGCWYPSELFPSVVQNIVKVLPTTWAMQGMLDLVLRGRGLAAVIPEAGVLLGFAAVFFLIGVLRFRYE
jgi:ABC-2 type transport system permease protein